jgi:polygalacturonase
VRDCIFRTDRDLRLKTRRGRGRPAIIDGIRLENLRMDGSAHLFVINSFYLCDTDGKSLGVGDRRHRPVDDLTNPNDPQRFSATSHARMLNAAPGSCWIFPNCP